MMPPAHGATLWYSVLCCASVNISNSKQQVSRSAHVSSTTCHPPVIPHRCTGRPLAHIFTPCVLWYLCATRVLPPRALQGSAVPFLEPVLRPLVSAFVDHIFPSMMKSTEKSARIVLRAVTAPGEVVAGQYIAEGRVVKACSVSASGRRRWAPVR